MGPVAVAWLMSEVGRRHRLSRLGRDGRYVLVALDHGFTQGPIEGLADPGAVAATVTDHGADAVITHRGWADSVVPRLAGAGYVVHLSGSTAFAPDPADKRLVCSVDRAIAGGADAVSVHVNVGSATTADQLEAVGGAIERAHGLGVPVLAMVYPRGPDVAGVTPESVAAAVRIAGELGADVIKTANPGARLAPAVEAVDAPVLVAGGDPDGPRATLEAVSEAMGAGAAGVSIGRAIFQATDPGAMTAAVAAVVHEGAPPDSAADRLSG